MHPSPLADNVIRRDAGTVALMGRRFKEQRCNVVEVALVASKLGMSHKQGCKCYKNGCGVQRRLHHAKGVIWQDLNVLLNKIITSSIVKRYRRRQYRKGNVRKRGDLISQAIDETCFRRSQLPSHEAQFRYLCLAAR